MQDPQKIAFRAFERVRVSGVTNMYDRATVCRLSGITREEYADIIAKYDDLAKRYAKDL